MKLAVMSDVHGFSIALDHVLADIATVPGIDRIVIAGDLAEEGPDPAGAIDCIRALENPIVLQGNTDRDIANGLRSSKVAQFTRQQLGKERLRWLRDLPFSHRFSPPGGIGPADDLLVVHANPFDQDRHIRPDAGSHELRELIGDTNAAMIAFGHLHIAYIRRLHDYTLVDVSAVGNPKDGTLLCKWALIEWDEADREWTAEIRYVDYPLVETETQIMNSSLPNSERTLCKLRKASYA